MKGRTSRALSELKQIYGWKDEQKKGRTISLCSALLTAVYNVFITGVFHTGFLSMYDIDLVGVGIISFIPPLANCFFMFSPMILERIQHRKWVLVGAKVFFYALYIIATTVMPLIVKDTQARVLWFCILQFVSHAVYSMFSAGFTPWFYAFYPEDQRLRAAYISDNQIFSSVASNGALLLSGVMTMLAARAGRQNELVLGMRYFAFVLVLLDVGMQAMAKEYPYPVRKERVHLREVFTLSLKYEKFMACLLLIFAWNYISNLNSGLWSYFLLNTVGFPYSTINFASATYPLFLLLFTPMWRRVLGHYSWIRTFGFCVVAWVPTELMMFFLSPVTKWIYLPAILFQHLVAVGLNLSYANIFYMNLPRENATTHTCFQSVFCNVFAFLGLMTGTLWCNAFGSRVLYIGSVPITAVQFTTIFRTVTLLPLGIFLMHNWRRFTPDHEIEAIELAVGRRNVKNQ